MKSKMNSKKLLILLFVIVLIVASLFITIINKKESEYSKTYYNLGTVNQITLYNIKKNDGDKILEGCENILNNIDSKMSRQISSSEVSKINKNAGKKAVTVSDDTYYVIKESIKFSKMSNDTFDVTIGPVINLWGIGTDNQKLPTKSEIKDKLSLVDYNNIVFDDNTKSIKLTKKNMQIDLGGIAKGYAADEIYQYLKEQNIDTALINLGGNVCVLGNKENNQPFSIGIQDPTKPRGNSIGNINVSNKSVVTSGIYERYFKKNNKIYHHMLDPNTGYPFDNNLSSVTIISNKSIICDALSTTTFGLGVNKGMKLIESLDNVDAIFITKDKKIYITSNLKNKFNLTDTSFTICK